MNVDGDLLGAASLALGALAVIYGLWSPLLAAALGLGKAQHLDDRGPAIRSLRGALYGKALPLMAAASGVFLVLAPPALAIVVGSVVKVFKLGLNSFLDYDPVQALFLIVWCMVAGLAVVSAKTWKDVRDRLSEFERA